MEKDREKKLDISLSEQVASGVYSNLQIVQHSPTEFVIDFIQIMPNVPKAQVKSRVVLNPIHAKKLLKALSDNVKIYENNFGPIELDMVRSTPFTDINPMGKA